MKIKHEIFGGLFLIGLIFITLIIILFTKISSDTTYLFKKDVAATISKSIDDVYINQKKELYDLVKSKMLKQLKVGQRPRSVYKNNELDLEQFYVDILEINYDGYRYLKNKDNVNFNLNKIFNLKDHKDKQSALLSRYIELDGQIYLASYVKIDRSSDRYLFFVANLSKYFKSKLKTVGLNTVTNINIKFLNDQKNEIEEIIESEKEFLFKKSKTLYSNDRLLFEIFYKPPYIARQIYRSYRKILSILAVILVLFIIIFVSYFKKLAVAGKATIDGINNIASGNYGRELKHHNAIEFKSLHSSINRLSNQLLLKHQQTRESYIETVRMLIQTLEFSDGYTKGHSERVAYYSEQLGLHVGYENIPKLKAAALMHDIGKVAIPDQILNKPAKLTDTEYDRMKWHPEMGHKILGKTKIFDDIKDLVLYHHEQYDGKGYPRGIKENEIPLGARIIAIADVFDALTTRRSYKENLNYEHAIQLLKDGHNTHFDGELLDKFLEIAKELLDNVNKGKQGYYENNLLEEDRLENNEEENEKE